MDSSPSLGYASSGSPSSPAAVSFQRAGSAFYRAAGKAVTLAIAIVWSIAMHSNAMDAVVFMVKHQPLSLHGRSSDELPGPGA